MLVLSAGPASTDSLQPLAAGVDDEPPPEPRGPDAPPVLSRYDPSVEQWRSQIWQGMPDSLKSRPDAATLLDKTLHAVQGESSGDPGATGDGGIAHGLFQSHYVGAGATPEAQIADAWRLVQGDIAGGGTGFGDWGEGRSYQGQPFGAFGRTPYGAGDPLAQHLSTGQTSSFIPGPSIAPQPFSPYVPQPDPFATTGAEQQMQYNAPQQDVTPYQPYVGSDLQQHLSTGGPRLLDVTNPSDYTTLQEQVEGATAPPQEGYTYDPNVMQSRANSVLGPSDNPLGTPLGAVQSLYNRVNPDIPVVGPAIRNYVRPAVGAIADIGVNGPAGAVSQASQLVGGPALPTGESIIRGGIRRATGFVGSQLATDVQQATGLGPRGVNLPSASSVASAPLTGGALDTALLALPEIDKLLASIGQTRVAARLAESGLGQTDVGQAIAGRYYRPSAEEFLPGRQAFIEGQRAGPGTPKLPEGVPPEAAPGPAPGPTDVGRPARPGMQFQPVGGGAPTPAEEAAQGAGRALPAGGPEALPRGGVAPTATTGPTDITGTGAGTTVAMPQPPEPQGPKRLVGAPPDVVDVPSYNRMLDRVKELAQRPTGAENRFWYEISGQYLNDMSRGDPAVAEKLARLVAISSVQMRVADQGSVILKGIAQHLNGEPITAHMYGATNNKIMAALNMTNDEWDKTVVNWIKPTASENNQKLGNFYLDHLDEIDPLRALKLRAAAGVEQSATIDRWMMRAFGFPSTGRTTQQYKFVADGIVNIAKQLGWTPKQVQAAIWVNQIIEQGRKVGDAATNYRDALTKHQVQLYNELLPGPSNPRYETVFPRLQETTLEQQGSYAKSVADALLNEQKHDEIAVSLGMMTDPVTGQPLVGPGVGGESGGMVEPSQVQRANIYAAARGQALGADDVVWMRPFPTKAKGLHNAMDVQIGRDMTPSEQLRLSSILPDGVILQRMDGGAWITKPPTEADFAARRDGVTKHPEATAENAAFQQTVKDAVNQVFTKDPVRVASFSADGRQVHVADYLGRDGPLERPEVRSAISAVVERVDAADAAFAGESPNRAQAASPSGQTPSTGTTTSAPRAGLSPTENATPPLTITASPSGTAPQPTTTNAPTPVTTTTQQPAPAPGTLPPIGDSGIKDALARKEEATLTPGQVFGPEGSIQRKVAGAINPSVDLPRSVHVANQARTAVQATLRTEFSRAEMPALKNVAEVFDAEKPTYTGPATNPLKNHYADYLEYPSEYDASPKLEAAKAAWDATGVKVLSKARGDYGVDIELLHPGQDPKASYVPHMQARDDLEKAVESTSKSLSSKQGIAKERGYPTLRERMLRNPDWKPELDPAVLADLHASSLASMAANNTFKAGVGGKTLTEVMEEQHPGLDKARQAAQGKISGAKQSIARAEAAAKTAGVTQEALDREIAGVRRRQGAAAGRMQDVEDQLPELTAMRNEVAELQARARAIARLTARAQTLNTAATAGGEAARSALEAEAKRNAGLFEDAHDATLRRIAPDVLLSNKLSPVERTKLREVWSRLKAMDDLASRAGNQGAAAARAGAAETRGNAAVQKLMDDVAEIAQEAVGSTNPADVDHAITGLEGRIRRLEDQLLARASGAAESQRALRGVEGSLHNASEVQRIRQAAQEAKAAIGQARLPALQTTVENARGRYRTAAIEGYELNRSTYRYHEPVVNRAIDSVLKPATFHNAFIDAALKAGNLLRAYGLGPDFSPWTIQGGLGALSHPEVLITNAANFVKIFNSDEAYQKLLDRDSSLVSRYEFARGSPLGSASEDVMKATYGPKLGLGNRPIKRFNDALERVVDWGSLKAFENDSKILQSGPNGLSQNKADAESESANSKLIPRINNAAQGRSPQRVSVEGALPTSRSFTVQPFALAKDFVSGAAKLTRGAAGKIPGVGPGPELSGREDLAIIRGIALLGSLMTISITSALLSAEANKKDPVQAVKEVMDPSSGKFFNLILGNQGSIGLGGPMRSAFLGVWRTMTQGPQGGINYARSRLEPVLGAGVDVVSNTDFRGNPVRTGSPWNQLYQTAVHIAQGANLLGGGISQGYGESGVQGAAEQAVSGLGGVNYQERSQYEKRDLIARQGLMVKVKQADGSEKEQLMKANSYQSASPLLKDAINKMNVTDLNDYRKASDTVHQPSKAEVTREEGLFNKGQNDQALRDVYQREGERNRALATSLENQFASQFAGFDKSKFDNAVEGYYALSQAKENQIPEGELGAGGIDFDKVASAQKDYLASLPADQRQWVSEALQVAEANKTPLHQEYDKYIDAKKQAGYFVTHIDPVTKRPTGITPQQRQALDIAHPELDVASWRFGSVGGKAGSALNSTKAVQMALQTPDAQNKEITFQGLSRAINQSSGSLQMWKDSQDVMNWYLNELPNGKDAQNEAQRLARTTGDKEYQKSLADMDPKYRTRITDNLHTAARKDPEVDAYLYEWGGAETLNSQAAADKANGFYSKYNLEALKAPKKAA